MEPEQIDCAAKAVGSKYMIPSHDFSKEVSDAANPVTYNKFVNQYPALDSYKKVEIFMEIMKKAIRTSKLSTDP